jgi:hypothetical protein
MIAADAVGRLAVAQPALDPPTMAVLVASNQTIVLTCYSATTALVLVFSAAGELMVQMWEGNTITVQPESRVMIVPAGPPTLPVPTEYNAMKPEKRTLGPGQ